MADHLQSNTNVTGHLEKRREHWHMVLNWYSLVGTRKRKSKSTGLPVKGNKKRAEQMLAEFILNFEQSMESKPSGDLLLFADFLEYTWFVEKENSKSIRVTTLACYETVVKAIVAPYFREKEIPLIDLTEEDIEEFYAFRLQTVKATTVHKDHVVINSAIKMALRKNLISRNMMSFVTPPKKQRFQAQFFAESEVIRLFEVAKGHELELAIILGAYYGLRRSEVVGLRWSAINFEAETLSIEHTITKTTLHGKRITCVEDLGKSDTSLRTLPLVPAFKNKLLEIKLEQQKCQKSFGRSYNKKNAAYVYKDPLGELIDPDHITESFPKFLEKHEFRRIRFHDLRHSCASLLLANDVPLIKVSDWLGHSEISVTADIYGHLEYKSKIESANAMTWLSQTSLGKEFDPEREDVSTHEYGQKNNQPILSK